LILFEFKTTENIIAFFEPTLSYFLFFDLGGNGSWW